MEDIKSTMEGHGGIDDSNLCELHGEKLESYCVSCRKVTCSTCWTTLHAAPTGCSKCDLIKGLEKTIKDRTCDLSSLENGVEGTLSKGKSMLKSASLTKFLMIKSLKSAAQDEESLTGMINSLETELERIKDIKTRASDSSASLDSLLESHDEVTNYSMTSCQQSFVRGFIPLDDSCTELLKMYPVLCENMCNLLARNKDVYLTVEEDDLERYGKLSTLDGKVHLSSFTEERPLFDVTMPGDPWLDYIKKNSTFMQLDVTYGKYSSVIRIILGHDLERLHIDSLLSNVLKLPSCYTPTLSKYSWGFLLNTKVCTYNNYGILCSTHRKATCSCANDALADIRPYYEKFVETKEFFPNSLMMDSYSNPEQFFFINDPSVRQIDTRFVKIGQFYIESSTDALEISANWTAKVQIPI